MARVIFSAEYEIKPDKVDEYLEKVVKLTEILRGLGYEYSVLKDKKKSNTFWEIFTFASEEDFMNFDDVPSDEANEIIYDITTNLVDNKKVNYRTLVEI